MTAILFGAFIVLILLGVPISFVLGIAATLGLVAAGNYPMQVVIQRMFAAVNSFPFMAIPFFMVAGEVMSRGGITKRIIDFALALVGRFKGSLAHVTAVTGVIMGGISGSGVADTAAIGSLMIPEMARRGYDKAFSAALTAAAGSIGLIIPPSIAMILYGVTAQASIGDLFLSGIIPGVMIGLGFMLVSYIVASRENYPVEEAVPWKEKLVRFRDAIWALMMPVIIIGGIRGGIFTATEGGAVAAVYAIVVSLFVYREMTLKDLFAALIEAGKKTAIIGFLIATSSLFSWILASERIPEQITSFIVSLTDNKYMILLLINILLLLVGTVLDSGPAIILLVPILVPVAKSLGIDLVQFGLIMVINLTMGLLTPPVGTALYVACNISGLPLLTLSRAVLKFLAVMLVVLVLMTYVPALALLPLQLGQ
ncbi:MAG: TRAP transporter large permease [Thermoanaerobacteraceae bacterium]|nr:TRAP transporter large permease [Thermoanaerobacteraceae bacterium]